jgi:hypothetical protein
VKRLSCLEGLQRWVDGKPHQEVPKWKRISL